MLLGRHQEEGGQQGRCRPEVPMEVPAPAQLLKLLCRLRAAPPPPLAPTPACLPGQALALGDPPTGSGQGPENRGKQEVPAAPSSRRPQGPSLGGPISSARARGPRSAYLGGRQIPIGGRGACWVGFPATPWPPWPTSGARSALSKPLLPPRGGDRCHCITPPECPLLLG